MRIFLIGAGYSAQFFAQKMKDNAQSIYGTTRSIEKFETLKQYGIEPLVFAEDAIDPNFASHLKNATHIVISAAPGKDGDPALPHVEDALNAPDNKIEWIGYLSTVGVYGDHKGALIDETAACNPSAQRSNERIKAEKQWLALGEKYQMPVAILRLSGIYGPDRNAFVNLARGTARRIIKKDQIFNRIHVEDIAGSLEYLSTRKIDGIFNITDHEPAPPQDVVTFAAELMGVTPPEEIDFDKAEMTPMARSFYGENKRVSNKKITETGYQFIYPNYRIAFKSMWEKSNWRSHKD
ncbi:SDR family oxidoreductase [Paenochrobactrum sp. BZR 588]|uniref:SDR family oxidoreductase n=1 Tax=unclassified Paenochrobactrum TaxID=2639760 RepID=UPI0038520815